MKTHTNGFKTNIKLLGREIDSKVRYTLNGDEIVLSNVDMNSISPHYEGGILKSVMKQIDIDSNVDIPLNTEINYKFGLKVGNSYEYLDFGNYIVYSSEKQEDTRSWKIVAYDKMLYTMKEYKGIKKYVATTDTTFVEDKSYYEKNGYIYTLYEGATTGNPSALGLYEIDGVFPCTIREYLELLCNNLGLEFANKNDTFANYDRELQSDPYVDANGTSLGYTYRDVLDQLAEATASTICLDTNDEVEVRYINNTNDTINAEYLKDINVNFGEKYGVVNSIVLSRSAGADNIYLRDEESVELNGLCEIKIEDNQIMNNNDREDYLPDILEVLDGFEYYVNDFSSTGITYYELCDRYRVNVDGQLYTCVMLNNEINITQGIEELVHTDLPEESQTDYSKSDKTDRKINQAYSIVDKQNQTITNFVSQTTQTQQLNEQRLLQLETTTNSVQQTIDSQQATIEVIEQRIVDGQETLKNNMVSIDINGINVSTNDSAITTLMTNEKFVIKSGDTYLAYFGYDENTNSTKAEMDNLTVSNYFVSGYHRTEKMEIDGEYRTGWFYMGGSN